MGLQSLIDISHEYLRQCGLEVNTSKSHTLGIVAIGKEKKTIVDARTTFKCGDTALPTFNRDMEWQYLGVKFSAMGRVKQKPGVLLGPDLTALTKAAMKPQQRLFALKHMVIPRVYHQLALGNVTIGELNRIDHLVHTALRGWLSLPTDVPSAYYHAAVEDGGLGIPSLRWIAPLLRRNRLIALRNSYAAMGNAADTFLEEEIAAAERRLTDHGLRITSADDITTRWSARLHRSVDGVPLKDSRVVPAQHQWIADGNQLLSGRDFVNCNRLRIGALPTLSRTSRGRHRDRRCRAGCLAKETLHHVLQQCHRTHGERIKRHNAVLSYVARRLRRCGYTVQTEPHFNTRDGLRKPDLVGELGSSALVIDAQVVAEQAELNRRHREKTALYANNEDIKRTLREDHKVTRIDFTSITLSSRGIWSGASAADLLDRGILRRSELKILSTRVLIGGLTAFWAFNRRTTAERHPRSGIG